MIATNCFLYGVNTVPTGKTERDRRLSQYNCARVVFSIWNVTSRERPDRSLAVHSSPILIDEQYV